MTTVDAETHSVEEAATILGIGRDAMYELVRAGTIRSFRVGRRIRVPRIALEEFLATAQGSVRGGL